MTAPFLPTAAATAMPPPRLPDLLHALEGLSMRMRLAAEAGDWPAVDAMQGTCNALIDRVRRAAGHDALSTTEQADKQRIMLALLRDDARIRELAAHLPDAGPAAAPPGPGSSWMH
jgi:flagellar protein FliT